MVILAAHLLTAASLVFLFGFATRRLGADPETVVLSSTVAWVAIWLAF